MRYDVVVIAAGSAGSVLATYLSFVSILESAVGHHVGRTHR
jgi:glycine/D-amino acid oxidase-like deaminating enzyme